MKIIFHIDLDSYFVSAERIINPKLKNKSVVICRGTSKSIVTAASYEAKKRGIKVGAPFYLALQKDPNVIAIKPNYNLYIHFSNKVFEYIVKNYTNKIEIASIDECYIDATTISRKYGNAMLAAKHLQASILKHLKLPLSIGISSNKFVAKMSTSVNKPFGITQIWPQDFLKYFGNWSITRYYGIGRSLAPKLKQEGIKKIRDLASVQSQDLKFLLGKNIREYIAQANGIGSDIINSQSHKLKSVGNSTTFENYKMNVLEEILEVMSDLCRLVSNRCYTHNVVGRVVAVAFKAKTQGKKRILSKQTTLVVPISNYNDLYKEASELFNKIWKGETIQFLSVTLNKLENVFNTTYQMNFYESTQESNEQQIVQKINSKFSKKVVYLGKEELRKRKDHNKNLSYLEKDKFLNRF